MMLLMSTFDVEISLTGLTKGIVFAKIGLDNGSILKGASAPPISIRNSYTDSTYRKDELVIIIATTFYAQNGWLNVNILYLFTFFPFYRFLDCETPLFFTFCVNDLKQPERSYHGSFHAHVIK